MGGIFNSHPSSGNSPQRCGKGVDLHKQKKISKSKFYALFKFPAYNSVFPNILLQHKNTKYVLSSQCLILIKSRQDSIVFFVYFTYFFHFCCDKKFVKKQKNLPVFKFENCVQVVCPRLGSFATFTSSALCGLKYSTSP